MSRKSSRHTNAINRFDDLDACYNIWNDLPIRRRSRQQQVVIDVMDAIGLIEGDGLHGFWASAGAEIERITDSLRLAGLADLAEVVSESSFCRDVIAQGTNEKGHWSFSKEQGSRLSRLERQFYHRVPHAKEALMRFLPKREA
jgi:hypothetical protein